MGDKARIHRHDSGAGKPDGGKGSDRSSAAGGQKPVGRSEVDLSAPAGRDIHRAQGKIAEARKIFPGYTELIKDPPLLRELSGGAQMVLALENRQLTNSYKLRGVFVELMDLTPDARAKGVIAASSGNHGKALAYLARELGIPCVIVTPEGAPDAKTGPIIAYGGKLVRHGVTYDDAYLHAKQLAETSGATFVDVSSRLAVAGQGTLALEMLEQVPRADAIVVPAGGGALLAGVAIAVKEFAQARGRKVLLIGAEPEGAACCYESVKAGKLVMLDRCETIADGLKVRTPDAHLFPLWGDQVDEM